MGKLIAVQQKLYYAHAYYLAAYDALYKLKRTINIVNEEIEADCHIQTNETDDEESISRKKVWQLEKNPSILLQN